MNDITFNIVYNGSSFFVKMRKTQHLRQAMLSYCRRNNVDFDTVLFQMSRTGTYLSPTDTPRSLQMKQNEEIIAIIY